MTRIELRFAPQAKLACHPQFADIVAGKRVYPVNVEISPSGVCQADCGFCFYKRGDLGGHRNVMLHFLRLGRLLHECAALGVKSISWTGGGEPSLHPDIGAMISIAHGTGLQQGIFTNALSMPKYDPAMLSWIRITMTDRPPKIDCIRPLRACKTLGFAFNYRGPEDDAYLGETLALAEEVGADYVQLRPALRFHGETVDIKPPGLYHPLLYVTPYKFEDARHKHSYSRCEGYKLAPFIWEDGSVDVCAYMRKHPGYTLGNIYQQSLKEILDASPASVPVSPSCQVCCKLDQTNKAIHAARELQDVNFP